MLCVSEPFARPTAAPAAYVGPGDIETFTAWWGLRAYSSATRGSAAVRLKRSSDNTEGDIATLSTGALNLLDAFFDGSTTFWITTLYDQTGGGIHLTNVSSDQSKAKFVLASLGTRP